MSRYAVVPRSAPLPPVYYAASYLPSCQETILPALHVVFHWALHAPPPASDCTSVTDNAAKKHHSAAHSCSLSVVTARGNYRPAPALLPSDRLAFPLLRWMAGRNEQMHPSCTCHQHGPDCTILHTTHTRSVKQRALPAIRAQGELHCCQRNIPNVLDPCVLNIYSTPAA